jgi:hypothetical protein
MYAGISIGTVELKAEPLSAGWLHPSPAYASRLRDTVVTTCGLLARAHFRPASEELRVAERRLAAELTRLTLHTPNGARVEPVRLELWDQGDTAEPFVLADFGLSAAAEAARPHPPLLEGPAAQGSRPLRLYRFTLVDLDGPTADSTGH